MPRLVLTGAQRSPEEGEGRPGRRHVPRRRPADTRSPRAGPRGAPGTRRARRRLRFPSRSFLRPRSPRVSCAFVPGSVQAPRAGRRGRAQGRCGRCRLRPGLWDDAGAGGRRRGAGRGAPDSGIARRGWARAPGTGAESGGAMNGGRGGGRGAEPSPKWLLSRGRGAEPAGKPGCWIQRGGRAGRGGGGEAGPPAAWSAPPSGAGPQINNKRRPRPPTGLVWKAKCTTRGRGRVSWQDWVLDHLASGPRDLVATAL